ncbi:MAG: pyridoxal-phosphate dependent enzyme, partial [Acidimicrobiales bacterium]
MIGRPEIEAARRDIAGVVRPTPVFGSEGLSLMAGRTVLFKPEHLQRTGSFKIRGAYHRIAQLAGEGGHGNQAGRSGARRAVGAAAGGGDPGDAAGEGLEVVAASAGNHAQGVALAARLCGLRCRVFMPLSAPLPKLDATRGYGAEVELVGEVVDDCIVAAISYAHSHGAVFV